MDTFSLAPASRRGFSCGLAIAVLRPLLYIWAGLPPDPPPRHLGTLRPRLRNPGAFLCRRGFSCARHATERFGTKFTSENWNCWRGGHPYTPVHPPRLLVKLGPAPTERGLFLRWRQSALVQVHQARSMNRPRCWERFPTVLIFRRDCHVEHYERRRDKNPAKMNWSLLGLMTSSPEARCHAQVLWNERRKKAVTHITLWSKVVTPITRKL